MSANSPELHSKQLLQLSDEVNRIAGTLARLSVGPDGPLARTERSEVTSKATAEKVRAVIRARRLRDRYFPGELFADPAWDMLLELFRAELSQQRTAVSSLCYAAAVPATTALRWIKAMVDNGLLIRRGDPLDGRRIFVELAPDTHETMYRYFAEIADPYSI